jgi:prepilin-type N-terminal cleavage/methylation domain-containing protein
MDNVTINLNLERSSFRNIKFLMKGNKKAAKGFTLIELLVVIAIIAILSIVVILTLNPAELLRQSRDSNRISDLSVTKSAIAFYLASVTSPVIGVSGTCYQDGATTTLGTTAGIGTSTCGTWFFQASGTNAYSSSTAVDGSGWIPISFSTTTTGASLPGGSPLGSLPHDPLNNDGDHFYSYEASSSQLVFKLDAHMESIKYSEFGSNDVCSTDGGNDPNSYEQGTNLKM